MATDDFDKILFEIRDNGWISISSSTPFNLITAVRELHGRGLIEKRKQNNTYDLTPEGFKAVDKGGFENWQKEIERDELIDKRVKVLQLKELKGNIFHLKYWWLLLILAALVGEIIRFLFELV